MPASRRYSNTDRCCWAHVAIAVQIRSHHRLPVSLLVPWVILRDHDPQGLSTVSRASPNRHHQRRRLGLAEVQAIAELGQAFPQARRCLFSLHHDARHRTHQHIRIAGRRNARSAVSRAMRNTIVRPFRPKRSTIRASMNWTFARTAASSASNSAIRR